MDSVGDFIRHRRTEIGLSMQALALRAKISSAYISEIENKRKKMPPSEEALESIAHALELSAEEKDELMKIAALERAPEIIKKELKEKERIIKDLKQMSNLEEKRNSEVNEIPVYGRVTAGTGGLVYGEPVDFMIIPDNYSKNKNIIAFKVKGDSMAPKIDNGSYILVKENVNPNNGDIGVFVIDEEWYVKVYRKMANYIVLSSLNTFYKDIEVNLDEDIYFKCIGKVTMVQNFL